MCSVTLIVLVAMVVLAYGPQAAASSSHEKELLAPIFVDSNVAGLTPVHNGSVAWADYDGDDDLDVLITGLAAGEVPSSIVYRKNGGNSYMQFATLAGVSHSAVAWGDYNNDNKPDILLTGQTSTTAVSKVYCNCSGAFVDIGAGLPGVSDSSVAWGDYDNDGRQDILLAGYTGVDSITQVYHNNGNGTFTNRGFNLPGLRNGTAAWGDYDNDGRLDILLTGSGITKIYRNMGSGFTDINAGPIVGLSHGAAAWGDYNADGKLDIALTGETTKPVVTATVYRNMGGGVFSDTNNAALDGSGVLWGAAWGDYDNDGDMDLLLNGGVESPSLKVYRYDGSDYFTLAADAGLPVITDGSFAWGDFNGDTLLDIALTGKYYVSLSKVYSNMTSTSNTPPSAPTGLTASIVGRSATLQWNPSSDDHTPAAGLTYNLRVGTTPGGTDIVSPLAKADGTRLIPAMGDQQLGVTALLSNLPRGRYYWSVQAIDTAFAGSPFASPESSFVISYNVYLPLMAGNYIAYFEGPCEQEPNNSDLAANGPLRPGFAYCGHHNDRDDFFYFDMPTAGPLHIGLTTPYTTGLQLQLYYLSLDNFITYRYQPPFTIDYNGQSGLYYIFLFTETPNASKAYTLTVTYP
jgi:hypothetical protein